MLEREREMDALLPALTSLCLGAPATNAPGTGEPDRSKEPLPWARWVLAKCAEADATSERRGEHDVKLRQAVSRRLGGLEEEQVDEPSVEIVQKAVYDALEEEYTAFHTVLEPTTCDLFYELSRWSVEGVLRREERARADALSAANKVKWKLQKVQGGGKCVMYTQTTADD